MVNGWCSPLEMEVNSYNGGPLNLKWMFSFVCVVNWTHNISLLLLPLKVLVLLMCVGPHYLSTSCAAFNSFATLLKARCTVFHCFNKLLRGGLSTVTMEHLSRIFFFSLFSCFLWVFKRNLARVLKLKPSHPNYGTFFGKSTFEF
jgi:hypothetical protein